MANNSAVASGQIDVAAAYKNTRFIRFCNVYNSPVVFVEDTTTEQAIRVTHLIEKLARDRGDVS